MAQKKKPLSSYKALAYDIIGTLIDFEAGVVAFLRQRVEAAGQQCSDNELLESYARTEKVQQDLHPQKNTMDIFSLAWPAMCAELGMPESAAPTEEYKASVLDWQPFSDSVAALAYLKQHYVMFPITTGSGPATARFAEKLGQPFHHIFHADLLGYAKPDPRAFEKALAVVKDKEGIDKADVLLVAQSQFHDHVPAQKIGLDSAWIERRHDQEGMGATPIPPGGLVTPMYHFKSMAEFAGAVKESRSDS